MTTSISRAHGIVVALALSVTGWSLSAADIDEAIKASATASYVFQTYLKSDDIKIASRDGVVTLTGTVSEELHKSLAQQTVASLSGVKSVENLLEIKEGRLPENSDTKITARVKTALLFRRNVDASAIDVSVSDGIVTLRGNAGSRAQKELATEYAATVGGVKDVRNEMSVSTTAKNTYEAGMRERIDDASITAQVKMALFVHRSTSVANTKVVTNDGVVTLHGVARNTAEKDLVAKLAGDIKGVTTVRNEMSVEESR